MRLPSSFAPLRALTVLTCVLAGLAVATLAGAGPAGPAPAPSADAAPADAGNATTDAAGATAASDAGVAPSPPPPPPEALPDAGDATPEEVTASRPPSDVGFQAGLRAGFSVPFGLAKDASLSNVVIRSIPITIEAGFFFNRHFYVGAYVAYGFAATGNASSTCSDANITCSAIQWRLGGTAQWHFKPDLVFSPWVGGALGYDIVNLTSTDSTGAASPAASLHGFEMSVLAGADWKPLSYLGVGPYAELSTGHYAGASSSTSLFGWLTFGVRFRTGL